MTRAIHIAIVCFPGLGGSGVVASELARGLAARGHRVWVVATALPERLRVNGVKFEPVEVPRSPALEHGPYGLAVASHLVDLVRRERIDLVHVHYAVPHAAAAMMARQVLGARAPAVVVTLHGTDVTRLGSHVSVNSVTSFAVAASDGITTPSRFLRGEAATCFGIPSERIEVISNFVDAERFAPPAVRDRGVVSALFGDHGGGPILFHVSNFRPVKRTHDLLDVLARLRETLPVRLVLVGDGPDRAAVEHAASERGLRDATRFLGRRDDFEGLLGHADAFVLTSETESFGLAALEAMAAGVPVYGYRVGGLPEVVVDAGRLVELGDVDALAAAILAGLPDRDTLGQQARARVETHFRAERVIDAYDAYLRNVLADRGSR